MQIASQTPVMFLLNTIVLCAEVEHSRISTRNEKKSQNILNYNIPSQI